MNIYTLQAGSDTDALIAERVMGWRRMSWGHILADGTGMPGLWESQWSTDIGEALRLWDHIAIAGWQCSLVHKQFEQLPDDRWVFHGVNRDGAKFISFSAHAETRAFAIARGALAADCKMKGEDYLPVY